MHFWNSVIHKKLFDTIEAWTDMNVNCKWASVKMHTTTQVLILVFKICKMASELTFIVHPFL